MTGDALALFTPATRTWFAETFDRPTTAQTVTWRAVAAGDHTLVVAPTGSGKTLAAFLWSLDRLAHTARPTEPMKRCRVLYVSPLKALAYDVERNLEKPLAGISQAARTLGVEPPQVSVSMRTGDTTPQERRRFARSPSDILITTPESLYLLLTSRARDALRGVEAVIVDEVHAVAATKRGAHLALSLERLDALLPSPAQRIGLSATVRPVDATAAFLGGDRPVTVVRPPAEKTLEVNVEVTVPDLAKIDDVDDTGQPSVWPSITRRLVDVITANRSTIVFANSRLMAERLCARINELAGQTPLPGRSTPAKIMAQSAVSAGSPSVLARAHHGSMSREERLLVEEALKSGELSAVVATSSLELGIDMGAVDMVVQIGAPPSVAAGMQRVGRAGHQVGAVSRGIVLPTHRGDLVAAAVTGRRMVAGELEAMRPPRNPVDVLAQHIVAMVAMDDWSVQSLSAVIHRAAPFSRLSDQALRAVLDMLSGRYPSTEFSGLRPKLVWDRLNDRLSARPDAQRVAVQNAGTIPDRGLYGVFLTGGGRGSRVGELDEEMVYESRIGDVFVLGATSWRIDEITPDRVLVSPAPGQAARMPFWKGDDMGRPAELGEAIGKALRTLDSDKPDGVNREANDNLASYIAAQRRHSGVVVDDRTIVVERFRDELGDWRLVVHCVLGARVNRPWGLAIAARLRDRYGIDGHVMATDDGIVARLPEMEDPPDADSMVFDTEEIRRVVTEELPGSALFAGRFRECAARALLLPRRAVNRRQPLWQQRHRAGQLFAAARRFDEFPITAEAARECLEEYFDMAALTALMESVRLGRITVVATPVESASPFAHTLMSSYVAANVYGEDQPLAERRAAALNSGLLEDLLGDGELPLDPQVVAAVSDWLQWRDGRGLSGPEDATELLRVLGDLAPGSLRDRGIDAAALSDLIEAGRAIAVTVADEDRLILAEDAGRYRHGLGTVLPDKLAPELSVAPSRPLDDLVARYARTHPPFTTAECARRFGTEIQLVENALHRLDADGTVQHGRFTAPELQWCSTDVLRLLRRRTLAALRAEIAPVARSRYTTFLAAWQSIGGRGTGVDALADVMERLHGGELVASEVEDVILRARLAGYSPAWLDELTASGELLWAGSGRLSSGDGRVRFAFADSAALLLPVPDAKAITGDVHRLLLEHLTQARLFRDLADELGGVADSEEILGSLWDLVWGGWVSNDTIAPLRGLLRGGATRPRPVSRRTRMTRRPSPPHAGGRWYRLPPVDTDPTKRLAAASASLLDRHGIVVRGSVGGHAGGFAGLYPVLSAMEEKGGVRRGYFVQGLGAAQFADATAVDRLRSHEHDTTVVLSATDPANPFGAGLPWPMVSGHRPGRRPGALVVIDRGELVWFVERGGRSLLSFTDNGEAVHAAAEALSRAVKRYGLSRLTIEQVNAEPVHTTPIAKILEQAGFRVTPKGLRPMS
ncbi:MAG TPA: DEAD/DEAH box helicase [Candidatus Stackebrandtia excrementipullorum]|nr:DEAD/DEAH box helicase [Candidatus Stackebrandtia excrementipullorum]